jgi:hypothetical protein
MTLNRLVELLLSMQAEHGEQEVCMMLEIENPQMQINDVVKDVATVSYGVILIGTEWEY